MREAILRIVADDALPEEQQFAVVATEQELFLFLKRSATIRDEWWIALAEGRRVSRWEAAATA